LVTKAEAAALAGKEVKDGNVGSEDGPWGPAGRCTYVGATTGTSTLIQVSILGTKVPHETFTSKLSADDEGISQPGVGEDAKIAPGIITVYDHGTVFVVGIVVDGQPAPNGTVIAVAKRVLGRL